MQQVSICPKCGRRPAIGYACGEYFIMTADDTCPLCSNFNEMHSSEEREIIEWNKAASATTPQYAVVCNTRDEVDCLIQYVKNEYPDKDLSSQRRKGMMNELENFGVVAIAPVGTYDNFGFSPPSYYSSNNYKLISFKDFVAGSDDVFHIEESDSPIEDLLS